MNYHIINLTQHEATDIQRNVGVFDFATPLRQELTRLLTFDEIPNWMDVSSRAKAITALAVESGAKTAMIGGAFWLMPDLIRLLKEAGIKPFYSFSKRVARETNFADGTKQVVHEFKHLGWVPA